MCFSGRLAGSDELVLSFLCFFCGLSGLEFEVSSSTSMSSKLAESLTRTEIKKQNGNVGFVCEYAETHNLP